MKNMLNFSTDQLNQSLKRDPSLKSATLLKLGLTVNSFHAEYKPRKNHCRMKTDEYIPQRTLSTTSIFNENKAKIIGRQKQIKKSSGNIDLKRADSSKTLSISHHLKSSSTYKPNYNSKQSRNEAHTKKSLQKLRSQINNTNPEILVEQLKKIGQGDKKNKSQTPIVSQYYLLSSQLLQMMKNMKKKHNIELSTQRESYQKREQRLIKKIIQGEKKNQRCTALINQLRIRNIDVDGIWHEQKLNNKLNQIVKNETNR